MMTPKEIVDAQAKDPFLWAQSTVNHVIYLQQALRRLHESVEGKSSEQCARTVLD